MGAVVNRFFPFIQEEDSRIRPSGRANTNRIRGVSMKNYRIHFIRHGMTEANLRREYVGRTDYDLCPEGIRQLIQKREEYAYPPADRIFCSPLARCIQTAGILYPDCRKLTVNSHFLELDFGDFEGKTYDQLKDREDYRQWLANSLTTAPPGGESGEEFMSRLVVGLNEVFAQMMEEKLDDAVVITHGGVIMTLLHGVGLPKTEFGTWQAGNGEGYTVAMNTAMWMRDRAFEIVAPIPQPKGSSKEEDEDWEEDAWEEDWDEDE